MMEFPGKKDIKVTASDALEFEPVNSVPAKKGGGMRFALVLILVGGGAGAWSVYGDSLDNVWAGLWSGDEKGVPLIKAARGPVKVRPDNPGGLRVPDRDKLVYDRMQGASDTEGQQNRGPERLLPSAEQPLPKPVAAPALKAKPVEKLVSKPALKPKPKIKSVAKIKPVANKAKPVAKVPTLKDVKTAKRPPPPPPPPQVPKAEVPQIIAKPAPKLVAPKSVVPKLAPPPKLAPVPEPVAAPKPALIARSRVYLVQLAAARSTQGARDEWTKLRTKNLDLLGDLGLSVTKADLGAARGIFYRLRAGPLKDEAAARRLCAQLAKRKIGCLIIKPGQ